MSGRRIPSALWLAALLAASDAMAASDPGFFGTYCGSLDVEVRISVQFLGIPVHQRRSVETFHIRARLGYTEGAAHRGMVHGGGEVENRGERHPFAVSGTVTAPREAAGSVSSPGFGVISGSLSLSADADGLTASAMGYRVFLSKDCDNARPTARIVRPPPGEVAWGRSVDFEGAASDPEDSTIPQQRMVWRSDLDGFLGSGLRISRNFLRHGDHVISFAVTDSGGRSSVASTRIQIGNNAPNAPVILSPTRGAVLLASSDVAFRGSATDRESGAMVGEDLVWRSSLDGELGTGELVVRRLSLGRHTIRLTAIDSGGDSSSSSIDVEVARRPATGGPPSVWIDWPHDYTGMADSECLTLTATATDLEDRTLAGTALTWETSYFNGTSVVRTPLPSTGSPIEFCTPPTSGRDTVHTLTVTATDSDGLTSSDSIRIYVIPGGLI